MRKEGTTFDGIFHLRPSKDVHALLYRALIGISPHFTSNHPAATQRPSIPYRPGMHPGTVAVKVVVQADGNGEVLVLVGIEGDGERHRAGIHRWRDHTVLRHLKRFHGRSDVAAGVERVDALGVDREWKNIEKQGYAKEMSKCHTINDFMSIIRLCRYKTEGHSITPSAKRADFAFISNSRRYSSARYRTPNRPSLAHNLSQKGYRPFQPIQSAVRRRPGRLNSTLLTSFPKFPEVR